MKRVTASEARRNWFRILDEVVAGEVVVIERNGRRVRIEREDVEPEGEETPEYSGLITADRVDEADRWTWEWSSAEGARLREEEAAETDPGDEEAVLKREDSLPDDEGMGPDREEISPGDDETDPGRKETPPDGDGA